MGLRGRRGSGPGRAALGRAGLVLAVLLAAGVVSTWPALRDARSDFLAEAGSGTPIEGGVKAGDHLQTIWQLWLPGHQLRRGERLWIDPYSFQPEVEPRINFAGWPFSIVFGPLEWALGTVLAWNVFVLLGYLGAGGLAFLWLRSLELSTGAALPVWALSIRGSIGDSRSFAQVERYSADLADFVARDARHGLEPYVFVGWLVPLLAIAAVAVFRSRLAALLAAGALVPGGLPLGA